MSDNYEFEDEADIAEMPEFEGENDLEQFVGSALPDAEIAERLGYLNIEEDETGQTFLEKIGLARCDDCETIVWPSEIQEVDDDFKICNECAEP